MVTLPSASLPTFIARLTLQPARIITASNCPDLAFAGVWYSGRFSGGATKRRRLQRSTESHDADDIFDQLSGTRAVPRRDKSRETAIILLTR